MPVYSFSQIQLFRTCPLKYRLQYIDKIKPAEFVTSPDLVFGKAVHYALERLYKALNSYEQIDVDHLMMWFQQSMDSQWGEVPEDIDRAPYQQRGASYLHEYRAKYAPFENMQVVATEKNMVFSLDEAGQVKFRGVIDRIDKQGDTLIITDYKTSRHLPDADQTNYQEQLTLYAIGIQEKYGKYGTEIQCQIEYLHFGTMDQWSADQEAIAEVKAEFIQQVEQIQNQLFKYNMGDKHAFEAVENSGCRYCDYRDMCPLWSHMSMDDEVIPELGDKTVKTLVQQYGDLDQQIKALKQEADGIKEALKTYAMAKNIENVFGEEYQVSVKPSTNYKITDKDRLADILQEKGLLANFESVDQYKVKASLKDGELRVDDLAGTVQVEENATLRVGMRKEK